tara:strand:+ start:117 stop:707 length:591 start_codon:yes stop_codon:yes gene_type:complete
MLSKRKIEERKNRKNQILLGALKVFKREGIEKTTMDQVANESGFGKATLYYYYSSKDEIFDDVMLMGWKKLWNGIENLIIKEEGPRVKFINIIKKVGEIVKNDKNLYGFLFTAPNFVNNPSERKWKTYQERLYAILESIIDEGIKKKDFINIKSDVLMKAVGGLFHTLIISNNEKVDNKELESMIINLLNPGTSEQ